MATTIGYSRIEEDILTLELSDISTPNVSPTTATNISSGEAGLIGNKRKTIKARIKTNDIR